MIVVPTTGPGGIAGWLWDTRVEPHEMSLYRSIDIDEDRYGGAYSGAEFTAWPGTRPSDLDAGDETCEAFWRDHSNALHGRGDTAQAAYLDLMNKMSAEPYCWMVDGFLVVFVDHAALLIGSPNFTTWLEKGE